MPGLFKVQAYFWLLKQSFAQKGKHHKEFRSTRQKLNILREISELIVKNIFMMLVYCNQAYSDYH